MFRLSAITMATGFPTRRFIVLRPENGGFREAVQPLSHFNSEIQPINRCRAIIRATDERMRQFIVHRPESGSFCEAKIPRFSRFRSALRAMFRAPAITTVTVSLTSEFSDRQIRRGLSNEQPPEHKFRHSAQRAMFPCQMLLFLRR